MIGDALLEELLSAKVIHATNSIHADLHSSLGLGVAWLFGTGRPL
jgi:hypothetical protein